MNFIRVPGENKKHKVLMYALSTCAWCKRAKRFLNENKVEYEYVDVDLCSAEEKENISKEILSKGGSLSYPTILVDDKILITGFRKDKLKEVLDL
uniref:Glutaredoxin family protein n=1 Tax=candidate division WOR-3 bacterium TaxID=2052148 RepID=A0A7C2P1I9_UNCW3